MTDDVLWEGAPGGEDLLTEADLARVEARANSTDYVERGLNVSYNGGGDSVEVTAGFARVTDGDYGYSVFPDSRSAVPLSDPVGDNFVYLAVWLDRGNPDVTDDVSIKITADGSTPSTSAWLLLAIVDAAAASDQVTPQNRDPDQTANRLDATRVIQSQTVSAQETVTIPPGKGQTVAGPLTVDGEIELNGTLTAAPGPITGEGSISGDGRIHIP